MNRRPNNKSGTAAWATICSQRGECHGAAIEKDHKVNRHDGHFHDLRNDIDREIVIADIKRWIDARVSAA
ncbi:MAG TPA: hypothetical protein VFS57_01065 [Gemmatimonadaceae bacterium]|nr:hypothetical protein [Gemmatimonadaceae bacterium]